MNNPDTGDKILANTVTSATPGQQLRGRQHRSRCAVTVDGAQLTIVRPRMSAPPTPGGVVGLTTTVTNTGQVPYYGITMTAGSTQG